MLRPLSPPAAVCCDGCAVYFAPDDARARPACENAKLAEKKLASSSVTVARFLMRTFLLLLTDLTVSYSENLLRVEQCGLQFLVLIPRPIVVAVETFFLRVKRRPLLFQRGDWRQLALEILRVEILLGGAVERDVSAVCFKEVAAPTGLAISLIHAASFSVDTNLFLWFRDVLLLFVDVADFLREFSKIGGGFRRLTFQIIVTIDAVFLQIDKELSVNNMTIYIGDIL